VSYDDYLQSEDWKTKRAIKKARTSRCGICGATDRVDTHHLNYRNLVDVEMSDLRVMCRRCHFLAHELFREGKIRFTSDDHKSRWQRITNAVKAVLYGRPGWSKAELAELGVGWPPVKGWKTRLESTEQGRLAMAELVRRRAMRTTMQNELHCVTCRTPMRCLTPPGQEKFFYVCDQCGKSATKDSRGVKWPKPSTKTEATPRGSAQIRVPTEAEIEAGKSPRGGWTKKQLALWGVPWPPPHGWKQALMQKAKDAKR
jgi:hypothetical protein